MCLEDGCSNKANYAGQLCQKHGGKPCSIDGCTANAYARGVCKKHGANGTCKTINCSANAQKRGGYYRKHGGVGGFCQAIPPCNTPAVPGKFVCTMHGAHGICSAWGCTKTRLTLTNVSQTYCKFSSVEKCVSFDGVAENGCITHDLQ